MKTVQTRDARLSPTSLGPFGANLNRLKQSAQNAQDANNYIILTAAEALSLIVIQ
jgi:hypothetical protein